MYSLEVHMVDHCNLNCKGCSHFCPIVKDRTHFADIKEIARDIIRLNAIGCIPKLFKILGGEPLLHPQITESLEIFRGLLPHSKIVLWTNGLLLPTIPDIFFQRCEDFDIQIVVTPYGPVKNNEKIKEVVDKHWFIVYDFYFNGEFWASPLGSWDNPGNSTTNFETCRLKQGHCLILEHGKIFQCPTAAFAYRLNEYFGTNYEVSENDYVDIYNVWDERWFFINIYKPTPFCRYCTKECGQNFEWGVSRRDYHEWIKE